MIYIADLLFIYGSMMIYITDINNLDISGQRFIAVALVGALLSIRYSLKIRKEGKLKSIYFSVFVFISILLMCIYLFNQYEVDIFSQENWNVQFVISLSMLLVFIYNQYIFYVSPMDKLEKDFKFFEMSTLLQDVKDFIRR